MRWWLVLLLAVGALAAPRIVSLDFSAQGLKALPEELKVFPGLLQLNFSFNRLTEFKPPPQLNGLELLSLDANRLKEQPPSLLTLTRLRSLSLQGNELTTFSGAGLGRLQHLNLESNYLASVDHLEGMPRLYELDIANNALTALPPSLPALRHLALLDASGNEIAQVGPELFALKTLQDLDLSRNGLTEVPPGIGNLTSLVRLDVGENHLTRLPPEIGQLKNLQYLSLARNPGLKLDKSVAKLRQNLKALYLDSESLPVDPGVLLLWLPDTAIVLYSQVKR